MRYYISIIVALLLCVICSLHTAHAANSADVTQKLKRQAWKYAKQGQIKKVEQYSAKINETTFNNLLYWRLLKKDVRLFEPDILAPLLDHYRQWPDFDKMAYSAELYFLDKDSGVEKKAILNEFNQVGPRSYLGKVTHLEAIYSQGELNDEQLETLKDAFVHGDFSAAQESRILKTFSDHIDDDLIRMRVDRLLMEKKVTSARRLLVHLTREDKAIFYARTTLMFNKRGVDRAIGQLAASSLTHPGFVYDRVRWHMKRRNYLKAADYAQQMRGVTPLPKKWWKVKKRLVRELFEHKKFTKAYQLLTKHNNPPGSVGFAEAEWLAGWVALRFLNKPARSYEHFYRMHEHVKFPISKARARYWLGRAAEQQGYDSSATSWYRSAAKYITTFYGQLAKEKITPGEASIGKLPTARKSWIYDKKIDRQHPLLKAAIELMELGEKRTTERFIKTALKHAKNRKEAVKIAGFGLRQKKVQLSVMATKYAAGLGHDIIETGYPIIKDLPESKHGAELTHGIILQESRFDSKAISSANAIGLMQLLPSTAKKVSRKHRLRYKKSKLKYNPQFNARLGSHYIDDLIRVNKGSYIMSIGGYNGGPSNVRKWVRRFGDPRNAKNVNSVIDWIELVPFAETRNYIQRVLENKQIYQHLMHKKPLSLTLDLMAK